MPFPLREKGLNLWDCHVEPNFRITDSGAARRGLIGARLPHNWKCRRSSAVQGLIATGRQPVTRWDGGGGWWQRAEQGYPAVTPAAAAWWARRGLTVFLALQAMWWQCVGVAAAGRGRWELMRGGKQQQQQSLQRACGGGWWAAHRSRSSPLLTAVCTAQHWHAARQFRRRSRAAGEVQPRRLVAGGWACGARQPAPRAAEGSDSSPGSGRAALQVRVQGARRAAVAHDERNSLQDACGARRAFAVPAA